MTTSTTHAPSWNLVAAKTHVTTAVRAAPKPFTTILKPQRGSWRTTDPRSRASSPGPRRPDFRQRCAMPACERVNERKTPIA